MHKHLTTPWEAKGDCVFAGKDCIVVCDTDNADAATYEAKAKLMAAAPDLLSLVRQFREVVLYEIRKDERRGDTEGARLKGITMYLIDTALAKAAPSQQLAAGSEP